MAVAAGEGGGRTGKRGGNSKKRSTKKKKSPKRKAEETRDGHFEKKTRGEGENGGGKKGIVWKRKEGASERETDRKKCPNTFLGPREAWKWGTVREPKQD